MSISLIHFFQYKKECFLIFQGTKNAINGFMINMSILMYNVKLCNATALQKLTLLISSPENPFIHSVFHYKLNN